jgi:hypothetical protein
MGDFSPFRTVFPDYCDSRFNRDRQPDAACTYFNLTIHPHQERKKEKRRKKGKNRRYSLTSGIHQVELTTMVHDLWYNWILPELMHKGGNLRVEHETFCGAAPSPMPLTSTPMTTVDEPGIVLEADFLLKEEGSLVMR